jgi:galactokinase
MNLNKLKEEFTALYGEGTVDVFFAPGRVNLIGEHIDYNGGLVMPATISLGIYGLKRNRNDSIVSLVSKDAPNRVVINLNDEIKYTTSDGWANYPKGVIKKLVESGFRIGGADIMFASTLPMGSGLSSSAAIEVLTAFMMLYSENSIDRIEIAKMCKDVENNFVGVNCGIMDQFAVSMGKKDNAILLNSDTLEYEYIPIRLEGYTLVVMDTGKRRELNESKYNERRKECEEALLRIQAKISISNLCEAALEDISILDDKILRRRVLHVITENERVKKASIALKEGDIKTFGKLLVESHNSLRDNFEVTAFYLDTIVEEALKQPGCIGARMTGAGFGGCAIAVVANDRLDDFIRYVSLNYKAKTGLEPKFYEAHIVDGVDFVGNL